MTLVSTYAPSNVVWGSSVLNLPFLTASKYLGTDANKNLVSVDAPVSPTWSQEIPSGAIDGTNTDFTILNIPVSNSQSLYVNGLFQALTSDYALSETTITFVTAPQVGDKLIITYQY